MAKSDIKIVFTADFETNKKGEVKVFSRDISNIFIKNLKVAEYFTEEKPKPKKVK